MQSPFPCPTATWRNDTYDSISPSRKDLSLTNKTVVIIGAGSGIGRETALTFAAAGASHVALLGRTEANLLETAESVKSSSTASCSVHVADITKFESLKEAAAIVGTWHVLVLSSGYCSTTSAVTASDDTDWWRGFETNVQGTFSVARAFLPSVDSVQATFLGITTDVSLLPVSYLPGLSSYAASKLAQAKVFEFIAAEHPNVFVATMNPGMIDTDNFHRTGGKAEALPMDTVQLPAHFLLWMTSSEAAFLRGRCAWANWDVEELKVRKDEILAGVALTAGFKELPKKA